MRKLFCAVVLCVAFAMPVTVLADMGVPDFTVDVYVGMSGLKVEAECYTGEEDADGFLITESATTYLSPGTRLSAGNHGGSYEFDYDVNGDGNTDMVWVPSAEFESATIPFGERIGKGYGTACDPVLRQVHTDDSDLNMRLGPARGFPSVVSIPDGTKLTYDCTYDNSGVIWVYTSYNGQEGWVCADYLGEVVEEKPEPEETTSVETVEETEAQGAEQSANELEANSTGLSGSQVILISAVSALVVSLTAFVIILIIKKRKNP